MPRFLLFTLILILGACASTDRMFRSTPFSGKDMAKTGRINLWPLFYKDGKTTSLLWPLFDIDEKGFAIRPIVAVDEKSVSLLGPLAGWSKESDSWWLVPAYNTEDQWGIFPLCGFGEVNHIGPAWWTTDKDLPEEDDQIDAGGIFPICGFGETNYIAPFWWKNDDEGSLDKGGLWPLVWLGTETECVFPLFWDNDEDEEDDFLTLIPLFHYESEGEDRTLVTPLGGRGWSGDGETRFMNIMGPLFHKRWKENGSYTSFLWPLYVQETTPDTDYIRAFPLFAHAAKEDESATSALCWFLGYRRQLEKRAFRLFPLFTYSELEKKPRFMEGLALVGVNTTESTGKDGEIQPTSYLHFGTWLGFNSFRDGDYREVNALANFIQWEEEEDRTSLEICSPLLTYDTEGDKGKTTILWHLYRSQWDGEATTRDMFPFISWDTTPESNHFSFLWHLINYDRTKESIQAHLFFFPLWDEEKEETEKVTDQPRMGVSRSDLPAQ